MTILASEGHLALTADSGARALALMAEHRQIDLSITDVPHDFRSTRSEKLQNHPQDCADAAPPNTTPKDGSRLITGVLVPNTRVVPTKIGEPEPPV